MSTVRIPSDIDQDDRLLGGLTARQLVLFAIPTVLLWIAFMATHSFIPLMVFAPMAVIVSGITATLVVAKHDGVSLDRYLLSAIRHHRAPKRYVPVVDALIPLPSSLAALQLPIVGVDDDGIVDLGADGLAVLCVAEVVNLGLQSEIEQESLTAAFGRFCNGMQDGLQIVVRTDPVDLSDAALELESVARSLPAVGLERAARDHAAFLRSLSQRHDVMRRTVLVVFHEKHRSGLLLRRAHDAVAALRPAGVELRVLGSDDAMAAVQRSCSPHGARRPLFDDLVTGVQA